jgi:GT2 family glycosyltransferase
LNSDSIQNYVEIMLEDESISALNPIQLDSVGKIDKIFEREIFDHNFHKVPDLSLINDVTWEVKTLFGAALFIRNKTIIKCGVFDPLYFAYWEEVDLCRRIKFHGGRLVVTSKSPITHLRTYNNKAHNPFRSFLRLKGMYLYRLKDLDTSLIESTIQVIKELTTKAIKQPKNDFKWKRNDYIRTVFWIVLNLPYIWRHKNIDKRNSAYL